MATSDFSRFPLLLHLLPFLQPLRLRGDLGWSHRKRMQKLIIL
jgi:hypothetical protein